MTCQREERDAWQAALDACAGRLRSIRSVRVVERTGSTQDEVRSMLRDGDGVACVAMEQDAGRGRLGRTWTSVPGCGVALSVAWRGRARADETLAIRSGVAVAEALDSLPGDGRPAEATGLKWPNDLEIRGRKVGGILIERSGDTVIVGVGINALQREMPAELAARATSLHLEGRHASRLDVAMAVLAALDAMDDATPEAVAAQFQARDRLTGTIARFDTPTGPVEGRVVGIDPWGGLEVRTGTCTLILPAATTSVRKGD